MHTRLHTNQTRDNERTSHYVSTYTYECKYTHTQIYSCFVSIKHVITNAQANTFEMYTYTYTHAHTHTGIYSCFMSIKLVITNAQANTFEMFTYTYTNSNTHTQIYSCFVSIEDVITNAKPIHLKCSRIYTHTHANRHPRCFMSNMYTDMHTTCFCPRICFRILPSRDTRRALLMSHILYILELLTHTHIYTCRAPNCDQHSHNSLQITTRIALQITCEIRTRKYRISKEKKQVSNPAVCIHWCWKAFTPSNISIHCLTLKGLHAKSHQVYIAWRWKAFTLSHIKYALLDVERPSR